MGNLTPAISRRDGPMNAGRLADEINAIRGRPHGRRYAVRTRRHSDFIYLFSQVTVKMARRLRDSEKLSLAPYCESDYCATHNASG